MENNSGVILKKKSGNFSIIPNAMLNDNRLSFKAKGILSYLLSKPNGWHAQVSDLYNKSTDGTNSIQSGLNELLLAGYCEIVNKKEGGREKYIYDIPLFTEKYRLEENKNKKYKEGEQLTDENNSVRKKGTRY